MALTKSALIATITEKLGFNRAQSASAIEKLIEIVKSTLESGEDVLVSGFGKFCVKRKKQRLGRNPATGDNMVLDARTVLTFQCSGKLKKLMNQRR